MHNAMVHEMNHADEADEDIDDILWVQYDFMLELLAKVWRVFKPSVSEGYSSVLMNQAGDILMQTVSYLKMKENLGLLGPEERDSLPRLLQRSRYVLAVVRSAVSGCVNCRNSGKFKCFRCNFARYCCAECQKANWNAHKLICADLRDHLGQFTTDEYLAVVPWSIHDFVDEKLL